MAMEEVPFENEHELDEWVSLNFQDFVPEALYLPGRMVSTTSGKGGVPDGFAFNLHDNQWYIVESELLSHRVWPHIAEQIVRFVVALQNPETRRIIRDQLFEALIELDKVEDACEAFDTTQERLLQQIELFIEGIDPQVLIFIDETNEDLYEMAQALSASVKVFRVRKFLVNDQVEYHSPDKRAPVLTTEASSEKWIPITEYDVVEALGGGEVRKGKGRFKYYEMESGEVIHVKRSKFHERNNYYWYGISPAVLERSRESGVTHMVFVMGGEGFVLVPLDVVEEFVRGTRFSSNEDGSVSHYHCLISPGLEPELYYSKDIPSFDLTDYFHQA
jgi:hypothetical protein